jgi:hypothetical protein
MLKVDSDFENTLTKEETLEMLDQLVKRKFVVRRGRNNRILAKAIVQNVFEDTQTVQDGDKQMVRNNRGQNHYLSKYEKLWTISREESKGRDSVYEYEPARRRPKR